MRSIDLNNFKQFKITQENFDSLKGKDSIEIECEVCKLTFNRFKRDIIRLVLDKNSPVKFCSFKCQMQVRILSKNVNCINCNKTFNKKNSNIKRSSSHFCSKSCAATYNNKNKTYGIRRSKLEVYLENQLTELYPELEILYSNKTLIGSELDIYIPLLKVAFEIQGIFHYEPIFGQQKLEQIRKNDLEKIDKCKELSIDLIHIDTRVQKTFSKRSSKQFLDKIINVICDKN